MSDCSYDIIGAAIEVHKELGPGLLEKYYELALCYELRLRGHKVAQQGRIPIMYKGVDLAAASDENHQLRYDLVVDDSVVIELKSVEELKPVYFKQLRTYLRFTGLKVGLLFNFNVAQLMKEGFGRVVLDYADDTDGFQK